MRPHCKKCGHFLAKGKEIPDLCDSCIDKLLNEFISSGDLAVADR